MSRWIDEYIGSLRTDPEFAAERLIMEVIGEIKAKMDAQAITQEKLAELMELSQPRVSKALSYSGNVTVKTLARIACALGCEWSGFHLSNVMTPVSGSVMEETSVDLASTELASKTKENDDSLALAA